MVLFTSTCSHNGNMSEEQTDGERLKVLFHKRKIYRTFFSIAANILTLVYYFHNQNTSQKQKMIPEMN